jgi:hypothetical protein
MEGFDMSDVQCWVVGITDAIDRLVPDERITLDLDSLRSCINDHVVRTVFPLTEDCVPETTRTLSLAVVADATFKPGREAVLFDGTIFVNPEQYLLLRKTDSRVLSRHYWKCVNLDGDIDATYTIVHIAMVREELHMWLPLKTSALPRRPLGANVASAWHVQNTTRSLQREPRCVIRAHHNRQSNGLELETTNEQNLYSGTGSIRSLRIFVVS